MFKAIFTFISQLFKTVDNLVTATEKFTGVLAAEAELMKQASELRHEQVKSQFSSELTVSKSINRAANTVDNNAALGEDVALHNANEIRKQLEISRKQLEITSI